MSSMISKQCGLKGPRLEENPEVGSQLLRSRFRDSLPFTKRCHSVFPCLYWWQQWTTTSGIAGATATPGVANRHCRATGIHSPNTRTSLPRPCTRMGMTPAIQFVCVDQSVWVSWTLPAGRPHPRHMVGAVVNTAWHPPVDGQAPVLTMGNRAGDWRRQGARHTVHSGATSYKRTSHHQSRLLATVSATLPQAVLVLQGEFLWPSIPPSTKWQYHFPYCQVRKLTINELIHESADAVPDSAVTEPNPGGTHGDPDVSQPIWTQETRLRDIQGEAGNGAMGSCGDTYLSGVVSRSLPLD